jgi:hypothetical protein
MIVQFALREYTLPSLIIELLIWTFGAIFRLLVFRHVDSGGLVQGKPVRLGGILITKDEVI